MKQIEHIRCSKRKHIEWRRKVLTVFALGATASAAAMMLIAGMAAADWPWNWDSTVWAIYLIGIFGTSMLWGLFVGFLEGAEFSND